MNDVTNKIEIYMRTIALRGERERASPRIVSNHFNDYFHKRIIVPPSMVGVVVFKKQVLATTKLFDQFAMPCVRTPRESFLCTILILLYTQSKKTTLCSEYKRKSVINLGS